MADEDKKDFNAMLLDSKDMPKFQSYKEIESTHEFEFSLEVFLRV